MKKGLKVSFLNLKTLEIKEAFDFLNAELLEMTEKVKHLMEAKKKMTKKEEVEKTNEGIKVLMDKAKKQKE